MTAPSESDRPLDHPAAVRAWAAHLAAGGTTPWRAWRTGQTAGSAPTGHQGAMPSDERDLPGAAQLEAVRRLAERRAATQGAALEESRFAVLADRVLATPGPGRGLPHLPVVALDPATGEAQARSDAIGARPADPARVPLEELLRVLTGVLPDLLVRAAPHLPGPQPAPRAASGTPRRTRGKVVRFRVAGPPAASAAVRAALLAAGHREGGPESRVVIVGLPIEAMLAEAWGIRVARGSSIRWHRFLSKWTADRLLVSVNLPALARHHATPAKRDLRTRIAGALTRTPPTPPPLVVLAPSVEELLPRVAEALGLPDLPPAPQQPSGIDAESADLLRRVHRIAGVSLSPQRCESATAAGVALLGRPGERPQLAAPGGFEDRIGRLARSLAEELGADAAAGRYAVAGDPALLATPAAVRSAPDLGVVLDRGLDLVLAAAAAVPEERS